jgi:hypothetical protein
MSILTAASAALRSVPSSAKNLSRVAVSFPGAPHTIFFPVWSATRVR